MVFRFRAELTNETLEVTNKINNFANKGPYLVVTFYSLYCNYIIWSTTPTDSSHLSHTDSNDVLWWVAGVACIVVLRCVSRFSKKQEFSLTFNPSSWNSWSINRNYFLIKSEPQVSALFFAPASTIYHHGEKEAEIIELPFITK